MFDSSVLSFEELKVKNANLNGSTFVSLMSAQFRNSSVNHCGFIHPAINLRPRGAAALAMDLSVCWIAALGLQISSYNTESSYKRGLYSFSSFQQIFCLLVSSGCLSFHPAVYMIKREGNSGLLLHRCPGFGLTYPLQSVLCTRSQAPELNWLCNSSFDLINHFVGVVP